MNKFSINVIARQIFLSLGARDNPPATLEKSWRALGEWLEGHGLSLPELVIENGAGLSRADRISSRHLAQVLIAAYRSPLMPEYVASLAPAAVDGTMKKRLGNSPLVGQAYMKTGYIEGVRAIAGYTLDARGRMLGRGPDHQPCGCTQRTTRAGRIAGVGLCRPCFQMIHAAIGRIPDRCNLAGGLCDNSGRHRRVCP